MLRPLDIVPLTDFTYKYHPGRFDTIPAVTDSNPASHPDRHVAVASTRYAIASCQKLSSKPIVSSNTEIQTKVNPTIGLKPDFMFRLSFGFRIKVSTRFNPKDKMTSRLL